MDRIFSAEDVRAVAKAVLEDAVTFSESDYGDYTDCRYCDASMRGEVPAEKFVHRLNCPTLIAKDLLT